MSIEIDIEVTSWPLKKTFTISRGSKNCAQVISLRLQKDSAVGRSESVPYQRYGESTDSVIAQIMSIRDEIRRGASRPLINQLLPNGAARNSLDCALWDLECKLSGKDIFELSGQKNKACITAQTLSIGTIEETSKEAKKLSRYPLLKVKLDNNHVIEKMEAIHKNAPQSQFIIDPNEGWTFDELKHYAPILAKLNVALLEQPVHSDDDDCLLNYHCPIPICADESFHTQNDLDKVRLKYQYINIKLDKAGGLTEALSIVQKAQACSLGIMVGCMVSSSLAIAPACVIASAATYVDLDGPNLLSIDCPHGFEYQNGNMSMLSTALWGSAF